MGADRDRRGRGSLGERGPIHRVTALDGTEGLYNLTQKTLQSLREHGVLRIPADDEQIGRKKRRHAVRIDALRTVEQPVKAANVEG